MPSCLRSIYDFTPALPGAGRCCEDRQESVAAPRSTSAAPTVVAGASRGASERSNARVSSSRFDARRASISDSENLAKRNHTRVGQLPG